MPPTAAPAAPLAPLAPVDPLDLGETGQAQVDQFFHEPTKPTAVPPVPAAAAPAPAAAVPTPPESSDRPRNPDGTFAKAPPAHPDYLVQDAIAFGYGEDELAQLPTSVLAKQIHRLRIQREQELQERLQQTRLMTEPPRSPEPQAPQPGQPDEFGLTPEEREQIHPLILATLERQAKQIKELSGTLGEVKKADEARQQSDRDRVIEAAFAALGPEAEAVFGKGSIQDLADEGQKARRFAAVERALRIKGGSFEKRLAQASAMLFPRTAAPAAVPSAYPGTNGATPVVAPLAPATNAPRYTKEEWEAAALERPLSRETEEPKGDRRAIKNLAARMGTKDDAGAESLDMDGIPD